MSSQLINALADGSQGGRYRFMGGSGYMVRIDDPAGGQERVRTGSVAQMSAWLDGFTRGARLPGPDGWWSSGGFEQAAARRERAAADVAQYRAVLVDPSLVDQLRIEVLAALEAERLNFAQLADRIGRSAQAVRDALSFGNPHPSIGTLALFDLMIRATGRRFAVSSVRPETSDPVRILAGERTEPAGLTRLRALVIAVERHLIDGVEPVPVNRARRATEFTLQVGGEQVSRRNTALIHWLMGVADGAGDRPAQEAIPLI